MLKAKYISITLVLMLFQLSSLFAQLAMINPPKDNAFIPRNVNTNLGSIRIQGSITNAAYTMLLVNVYQNHVLKSSYQTNFGSGQTSFNNKINLTAGKYIYTIELNLSGSSSYTKIIDGIMVGDAYLIQGQSNAVAANYVNYNINYSAAYRDTFIRSFGNSYPYSGYVIGDTNWYKPDAENAYAQGSIGQWPLVLAKTLLDSFKIPICVINGAVGGTYITQHTSTPGNPSDLNSIYGRLLYRVQKAGLENNIRGILYFQGESDGSNANLHDSLFRLIYNDWNRDYKGFKKLYVVQVRGRGCGAPSIQLRDYQRNFEFTLSKCKVISSNGLNNHDGCHYGFANGYELLGQQLAALVSRDIYSSKITKNIDPPNIKSCYYSNAAQDEITLNLQNPDDIVFVDNSFYKIFQVEGDTVSLINGFIRNNKVVLQLNKSSCKITGLTYDSDIGTQPWVKNAQKMGLISFYNWPIAKNQIQPFYTGCKKSMITMGEDSIPGCKYIWKRLANKQTYTSAKIKVRGDSAEQFSLIITYGKNACKLKDTLAVYLSPDPVTFPELGADRSLCKGDSVLFNPNQNGFTQYKWVSSLGHSTFQLYYTSKAKEKIVLTATSNNNCIYKDSVNTSFSSPQIKLQKNTTICPHTDTLMSVKDTFKTYLWNHTAGVHSYKASAGTLYLEVSTFNGCKAYDTAEINEFPKYQSNIKTISICRNESITIYKPIGLQAWYANQVKLKDSLIIQPAMPDFKPHYAIIVKDNFNCFSNDTIRTLVLEPPVLAMGNDTGYCQGSAISIQLPYNMKTYYWNSQQVSTTLFKINQYGNYTAAIINNDNCRASDTIQISEYALPTLNNFYDTILCNGKLWQPILDSRTNYQVNNTAILNGFEFNAAGNYKINAISQQGCLSQKIIQITMKDCITSNLGIKQTNLLKIYPNPLSNILTIEAHNLQNKEFAIYQINGLFVQRHFIHDGFNTLDLTALSAGTYLILIDGERHIIIKN